MAARATLSPAQRTADRRSSRTFTFVSMCPACAQERVQYTYTRRALLSLLEKEQVIDAYCQACDVVWPVSAHERVAIARAITAALLRAKRDGRT